MNLKTSAPLALVTALTLIGCGGSSTPPSATQTVNAAAGATLTAGTATLVVPAGALTADTPLTLRVVSPHVAGHKERVEVEPHHALNTGASVTLTVQVTDDNPRLSLHDGADDTVLHDVEVDDRNHHTFKTVMSGAISDIEVEVEHGTTCTTAAGAPGCAAGQECDDGVCTDHNEHALTCSTVCATGLECDDGLCKAHGQFETEHGHASGGGVIDPTACSPTCATGLVCHEGVCKSHG